MRWTLGIAIPVLLVASGLVAKAAIARTVTYGAAETRACLGHKGAMLRPENDPSLPANMPAAQRAEAIVGTLADGASPAFVYLVVGRSAADAKAIRQQLAPIMLPGPNSSNSWSGTSDNAAWTIVTLSGSPPGKGARATLLACLTKGSAQAKALSPSRYTRASVALCLNATFEGAQLSRLATRLFGHPIPHALLPHLLLAYTATNSSVNDGLGLWVVVGTSQSNALALRADLESALRLDPVRAAWRGAQKNVAWYAFHHKGTTAHGASAGRRLLLGCVR